eukprot:817015_1
MSQGGQRSSHIPHLVCNYPNHPNESRSHLRIAPQDPQISSYQKQHVNPFHNQYQTLHNKCEEYKQTIHRLQHHNQSLNTQCVDYKNEIQRLQRNNQTLTTHCHQSQGEIHRYKAAANHYELTMNTLTHQVSESQKKLKEWSDKYILCQSEMRRMQDEAKAYKAINIEYQSRLQKSADSVAQLQHACVTSLRDWNGKENEYKQSLLRLQQHTQSLNIQCNDYEDETQRLKTQCRQFQDQIREWQSSENGYKETINTLTERVSETENKLTEWSDQYMAYKMDIQSLQAAIKKYKATDIEYQSLLKKSGDKCAALEHTYQLSLRDWAAKRKGYEQQIQSLQNQYKTLEGQHIRQNKQIYSLRQQTRNNDTEYKRTLHNWIDKCELYERNIQTLTEYKHKMKPFVHRQKMWSFAFRNKMIILTQRLVQWHTIYETTLRGLVEKYQVIYGLCESYRKQLNTFKHEFESLHHKHQSVIQECERLKEQYRLLREQHRTLFVECDHYKQTLDESKNSYEALRTQKKEAEILLNQIIDEYPFVIRNTLFTQIKTPPSTHFQDKAFSMIQVILFEHPKYLYHEDQIWILFDMIWTHLGADCKHYKMKQCVLAIKAVKQCIGDLDASNNPKRLTLQQMQAIVASLMYIHH